MNLILCNCLQSSLASIPCEYLYFCEHTANHFLGLGVFFCVLSWEKNIKHHRFEEKVNSMVWLNLSGDFLVTFCWSGFCAWGDSMCFYEFKLVTWVASAENTWTTFSSDCSYIFCPTFIDFFYYYYYFYFSPLLPYVIISLQWKFDQSWCCILLSSSMLGFFFVTTISSAKCDVSVLIFQTKIVPRNVLHVSCCFLHTLVYITFTSPFSIVCAKTEQFNGFQRYPLNWWFWYDNYLIRSHLRASTCALRLSAWQSTWTLLHLQCCQRRLGAWLHCSCTGNFGGRR